MVEENTFQIEGDFAFRIEAFAENETLINELLRQPPDRLLNKGDEDRQKAYLETQVLIEIYEKFNLEIDPEFFGFLIPQV